MFCKVAILNRIGMSEYTFTDREGYTQRFIIDRWASRLATVRRGTNFPITEPVLLARYQIVQLVIQVALATEQITAAEAIHLHAEADMAYRTLQVAQNIRWGN